MEEKNHQTEKWRGKAYSFFNHRECEYFPCHLTDNPDEFNCLFCYCPLYMLGEDCGGNYRYVHGIKDCSACLVPHKKENYGYITGKFQEICKSMKK
ncbi:MAG: cysteine-rich small domain-containing protein [Hespellia sp.]|nr:cysteine-rich small domain-containing protein [Hespellia sp.]